MTTLNPKPALTLTAPKNAWRWLWQVPLLIIGLLAFGFGVRQLVRTIKPVPYETHLADIQTLITAKKFAAAIDQINVIANHYATDAAKQGPLQVLAGDAHYLANEGGGGAIENYEKALVHYDKAVRYGVTPTHVTLERWAFSALGANDAKLAVEKLEKITRDKPESVILYSHALVDAYTGAHETNSALDVLDRVLQQNDTPLDDRVWALCKRIELNMPTGGVGLDNALKNAQKAVATTPERNPAGLLLYWIGRAEYDRGDVDAAALHLAEARARFIVHHLEDGRAAILLGKIALARGQAEVALKLFREIVLRHTGESIWAAARFGQAEATAQLDQPSDQMFADFDHAVKTVTTEEASVTPSKHARPKRSEMIELPQVRTTLIAQYQRYAQADKLEEALHFLELQSALKEHESASLIFRLATTRERLARHQLESAAQLPPEQTAQRNALRNSAYKLLAQAADDYRRHARLTTLEDDISGNSLWRAAQILDDCAQTVKAIEVYEQFVIQRPRDSRVPEGLLALGQLHQSLGKIPQAISYYQRNIKENGKTPAAYNSAIYLAQCYMALNVTGDAEAAANAEKAEAAVLRIVQDNPDIGPEAREFRVSLFTLGEIYFQNGKWADAILRLEESLTRYPDDPLVPRATYLLAESYRCSARDIGAALQKDPAMENREALVKARQERLSRAATLFGRMINLLDLDPADPKPLPRADEDYLRTSYMSRAQCFYDLGDFPEAVKLYNQTATRFAQNVTAIEAYVQIINAYLALKEPRQASAAAERARWILKRIPDEEFGKGPLPLSRQYYEDFLKLGKTP